MENMTNELGYTVEMIHEEEFLGTFQVESQYEIDTIAKFHAKEYVPGEVTYQFFSNHSGGFIEDAVYNFKDNKAERIK